jgi:hypothetical protein
MRPGPEPTLNAAFELTARSKAFTRGGYGTWPKGPGWFNRHHRRGVGSRPFQPCEAPHQY